MGKIGVIPRVDGVTMAPPAPSGEVCPVCRRAPLACICRSHVDFTPPPVSENGDVARCVKGRPFTKAHIETLVAEGLTHYYNRDAEGLARWLRRVLP